MVFDNYFNSCFRENVFDQLFENLEVYLVFLDYALSLNIPKYRVSDFSWLRTIFFVKNMSISLCKKGKIANMS